jgi:serine/threonine protein phosphatase 1
MGRRARDSAYACGSLSAENIRLHNPPPMTARTPPFTYAIGDIHGRLDLLLEAKAAIAACAGRTPHRVICLGDYVDRGPHSKGVVETLMALSAARGWICLKGNHEDMMIQALRPDRRGGAARWISNGGDETLASYGAGGVPDEHLDWIEALPLFHQDTHRLYVHAGVKPGVPLEDQDPETLMWIRDAFLAAPAKALPRHVVHGHTPQWRGKPDLSAPELLPHRTNLDTGAVWTGVLSVGVFEDARAGGPIEVMAMGDP